jgi:hypothetical protein
MPSDVATISFVQFQFALPDGFPTFIVYISVLPCLGTLEHVCAFNLRVPPSFKGT